MSIRKFLSIPLKAIAVAPIALSSTLLTPPGGASFAAAAEPPTSIVVTTTLDTINGGDDVTSLREAITQANNNARPDNISFNIPKTDAGFNGSVFTIKPATQLPPLTDNATELRGSSQHGFTGNTNPAGPEIVLNGAALNGKGDGLVVTAANCVIQGLVINQIGGADYNSHYAIRIAGAMASNNRVEGCYIGTDSTGTFRVMNHHGIFILHAPNNIIGGTTSASRNVISGNSWFGVWISSHSIDGTADSNVVQDNYIGTNASGIIAPPPGELLDYGNNVGIRLTGATNTLIGGTTAGARNLIAAGANKGVDLSGGGTTGTRVQGNYIGTDVTGTVAIPNTRAVGISYGSTNNIIGGTQPGAGNLISGNSGLGVWLVNPTSSANIVQGNFIGTNAAGTGALPNRIGVLITYGAGRNIIGGTAPGAANRIAFNTEDGVQLEGTPDGAVPSGNSIRGNQIFANGGPGINLRPLNEAAGTVTPNDAGDGDLGPNGLQNYPVIESVVVAGSTTTITGTLNSRINKNYAIDFYSNQTADPSGFGEGENYLGSQSITIDGSGTATFHFTTNTSLESQLVTATATNITANEFNDTSEFSRSVAATFGPTISDIANRTITQGSNTGTIAFAISDPDTPAASLTLSGTSSNNALVPEANIVFGGSGSNRTITVTPAAGQQGSATITITVSDGTGTDSDVFALTVVSGVTVTGFSPAQGIVGTRVTITGSGFTGATSVTFNGTSAVFTVSSATLITATVPAGATTGRISVTAPTGTGTSANSFTVLPTFSVAGRVANHSGTGIPNVQITRNGGGNAVTDANGDFVFINVPSGSYTIAPLVTPALQGVTIFPPSKSVVVAGSNAVNQNFALSFSVSGRVANHSGIGIPNVLVQRVAGGSTVGAYTDTNGNYRFSDVRSGSYTLAPVLTPAMAGTSFTPASTSLTVGTLNVTNQNFIGMFSISGSVRSSAGAAKAGVSLELRSGAAVVNRATSAADGTYRFAGVRSGSYTVVAVQSGTTFSPASRSVTIGALSLTNQNFID